MSDEVKIERLKDSESFLLWKFEINIYLKAQKLIEVITTKQDGSSTQITDFQTKDAKVQSLIINTIDRKLKGHILGCSNALEMYKKLCSIFEGCEERNKSSLLQEFFNFKLENRTLTQLISDIENLKFRLNQIGQNINEEMVMSKILTCLPNNLNYFITAWESTPDDKKNLTNLTNRLLNEESRLNDNKREENQIAFKAIRKEKVIKCYKCNKTGHIKKDCKMCSICKKYNHEEKDCKYKAKQCSICKKTNHKEENCFYKNKSITKPEVALITTRDCERLTFIVDSGCTTHMTNDIKILSEFQYNKSTVLTANNEPLNVHGQGVVYGNGFYLQKTLYVPELSQNLLSVNAITNNKGTVVFSENKVEVYKKDSELLLIGKKENGLYTVNLKKSNTNEKSLLIKSEGTAIEWHKRLGHPGKKVLEILQKVADGINIQGTIENNIICEICTQAKQTRLPFSTVRTRANRPLQLLHTDVCGPFENRTYDGYNYVLTVMDDYTHLTKIFLLKHKSEVKEYIINYIEEMEREKKEQVSAIRCDNGGEYTSNNFKEWCKKKGIKLDLTIPYTPQLNGKAERLNRTLLDKTRALLFDSDLNKEMWGEAMYCATYLINRLPTEALNNKTPFEMWYNKRPNLANVQKFGSMVYAKQLNTKKLDPRSKKLIMVGYANNGYRLWNEKERKIEIARDVVFCEKIEEMSDNIILCKQRTESYDQIISEHEEINMDKREDNGSYTDMLELETEINEIQIEEEQCINEKECNDITDDVNEEENIQPRNKREKRKPTYLHDYVLLTFEEAMKSTEKENWEKAISSEKKSLENNNTWEIVDIEKAKGNKILTNKWVFNIKENGIYKARLVVRGFEQNNINFQELYSPVVSQSALKSLFAIAASKEYEMITFDVKTAFLYGELKEDIFMTIPEGYEKQPNKVCHLKKALYGLKQAPITWNKKFTETMLKLGLKPTKTDQCVFSTEDKSIIVAIYVDDGLAISKDKQKLLSILHHLEKEFKIKIYEKPTNYIGFEVTKSKEGILLHQKNYTEKLLKKYNMFDSKPASTPCTYDNKMTITTIDTLNFPYRELIGGLLYLSTRSRPDISQAVNEASKKIENPSKEDIVSVKKILKYLNGTRDKGIMYRKGGDITLLNAYSDSDYANCIETRRSTTGFVIMYGGGPISWCSKRQPIVSLSSTEAEYIAASDCCKECLYLKSFISELTGISVKIMLNIDNQSSIQLIKTGSFSKRSKHIDVRFYFIHENYKKGNIDLKYCPSNIQIADMFTKPLSKEKFVFHCKNVVTNDNID